MATIINASLVIYITYYFDLTSKQNFGTHTENVLSAIQSI